ncbi:MAG: glycoside hydrolase family 76 protein [Verrucomicrobiota bacterium]
MIVRFCRKFRSHIKRVKTVIDVLITPVVCASVIALLLPGDGNGADKSRPAEALLNGDASPLQRAQAPSAGERLSDPLENAQAPDHYRRQALEVMEDMGRRFRLPQGAQYAATPGGGEPDTVRGAGVLFSALVGAAKHDPEHYGPLLDQFFEGLNAYWNPKARIPGYEPVPTAGNGQGKHYGDNALLAISLMEAYELTQNPKFKARAEETLEFALSGWDETLNGGIWAHEKKSPAKNTCANAPTAVACLLSASHSDPRQAKQRIEMARRIVQWTTDKLQLPDGLFADAIGLDGNLNRTRLTYNSALMLRAFLGLYHATSDPRDLSEARRIGDAADAFLRRRTGAYRDPVKWAHLMVEADLELHRVTREESFFTRAEKNAAFYYEEWKRNPPTELITAASIARTLWLMADAKRAGKSGSPAMQASSPAGAVADGATGSRFR